MHESRKPVKVSTGESLFDPQLYPQVKDIAIDPHAAAAVWRSPDFVMRLLYLYGMQSYRTLPSRSDIKTQGIDPARAEAKRNDSLVVLRTELELAGYLECTGDAGLDERLGELASGFPPDATSFSEDELAFVEEFKDKSPFFAIVRENMPGLPRWERPGSSTEPQRAQPVDMRTPVRVAVSVDYL